MDNKRLKQISNQLSKELQNWDFDKAIIRTMDWYKANNDNKDMLDFSFKQIKEYEDEY